VGVQDCISFGKFFAFCASFFVVVGGRGQDFVPVGFQGVGGHGFKGVHNSGSVHFVAPLLPLTIDRYLSGR